MDFEINPIVNERRKSRIWRDGALTQMSGGPFQSPFGPPPNWTNGDPWRRNTYQALKNSAWCAGYWWAKKHRPKH